jgi:L-amino acid N-acyltransferase YncA
VTSQDVTIRAARADDAAAIARVYAPHVEASYASFEEVAPTAEEIAQRMADPPALPWLVAERDGEVVGFAYAAHHRVRRAYRWSCDLSVYLDASATGHRVGTELYARLIPVVRELGHVSAYAAIALPNAASVRLHEKHGFVPLGTFRDVGFKLGAWRDVAWFHLSLVDPPPAEPVEPRTWDGTL